jgi:hypothetical protein
MIDQLKQLHFMESTGDFILIYNQVRILQVFKMADVKKMNIELKNSIFEGKGLIIVLAFNPQVPNNLKNIKRFLESNLFDHFYSVNLEGDGTYFMNIHTPINFNYLVEIIKNVTEVIYDISFNSDGFQWAVNSYE